MLRMVISDRATYVMGDGEIAGVAAFSPPGTSPGWWKAVRFLAPALWRMPPTVLARIIRAGIIVGRAHPRFPHWHLQTLAVRPDRQRQGLGTALLMPTLRRAESDDLPVYLYTTNTANIAYYERFGFEVARELRIADEVTVFAMLRPAHA